MCIKKLEKIILLFRFSSSKILGTSELLFFIVRMIFENPTLCCFFNNRSSLARVVTSSHLYNDILLSKENSCSPWVYLEASYQLSCPESEDQILLRAKIEVFLLESPSSILVNSKSSSSRLDMAGKGKLEKEGKRGSQNSSFIHHNFSRCLLPLFKMI